MASTYVAIRDAVATFTMSNPAKLNALTVGMWKQRSQGLEALESDGNVRVVVLQGEGGRAFAAGADLSEADFACSGESVHSEMNAVGSEAYLAIERCSKPVIAKIRGACVGGGLGLAAACDLRVCADDARFMMPAARIGLGYPYSGVRRFVESIGVQNTMEIFATARTFGASEALRMGFVARVVTAEELDGEVDQLARTISGNAPLTLRALKRAVNTSTLPPDMAVVEAAIKACFESRDLQEGLDAFAQKRAARFTGS